MTSHKACLTYTYAGRRRTAGLTRTWPAEPIGSDLDRQPVWSETLRLSVPKNLCGFGRNNPAFRVETKERFLIREMTSIVWGWDVSGSQSGKDQNQLKESGYPCSSRTRI